MSTHTIRLSPSSPGHYDAECGGKVIVTASDKPIIAAALALRTSGDAADHDMIHVVGADFVFSATPIWKLTAPRQPPRRSDIERMARF
jgi:hypothetical protein